MIIKVDEKYATMLVNAIDALIKVYDQYGYQVDDIPAIASIAIAVKQKAKQAVKEADDEEEKFIKEHPEFSRGPNPDEKMVLGKGYEKVGKEKAVS